MTDGRKRAFGVEGADVDLGLRPKNIGARVKRLEAPRLLTGQGSFTADRIVPGALQNAAPYEGRPGLCSIRCCVMSRPAAGRDISDQLRELNRVARVLETTGCYAGNMAWRTPIGNPASGGRSPI